MEGLALLDIDILPTFRTIKFLIIVEGSAATMMAINVLLAAH
jgi:hypothetical protein